MSNIVLYSLSPFSASLERADNGIDQAVFLYSAHPDDQIPLLKLEFLLNTATMYIARWKLVGPSRPAELEVYWEAISGPLWSNVMPDEIDRAVKDGDLVAAKQILGDVLAIFDHDAAQKAMPNEIRALYQALSDFTGRAFEIFVESDRTDDFVFIPELCVSDPESWHVDAIHVLMYNTAPRGCEPAYQNGVVRAKPVRVRFTPNDPSEASTQLVQAFIRRPKKLIDDLLLRYIAKGPSPRTRKPTMSVEDELRIINQSGEH